MAETLVEKTRVGNRQMGGPGTHCNWVICNRWIESGINPQCTCHIKIQLGFSEGWIQRCIPATLHQEPDVDLEVPALRVVKRNYCNLADLASGSMAAHRGLKAPGCFVGCQWL